MSLTLLLRLSSPTFPKLQIKLTQNFAWQRYWLSNMPLKSLVHSDRFYVVPNRPRLARVMSSRPMNTLSATPGILFRPQFGRPLSLSRLYAASSFTLDTEAGTGQQTSPNSVILTVENMKCGGCSAAVKRILMQQPGVSNAAVNLLTETAVIQVMPGMSTEDIVSNAASTLTSKGFTANLRSADTDDIENLAAGLSARKIEELRQS